MNDLHGVGAHYDQVTSAWEYLLGADLHYGYFDEPGESLTVATARLTDRMAEAAQLDASLRVLDVGCGIGTPAMTLAERFGCRVTGITISEVGLNRACTTAACAGSTTASTFAGATAWTMASRTPATIAPGSWSPRTSWTPRRR